MIEENARVTGVDGDYAWLETQRRSTCGNCNARNGCGVSLIERYAAPRLGDIRAINRAAANPGDEVIVGIDEAALVKGSAAVYLSPLAGLFAGAITAELLAPFNMLLSTEAASIALGMLGLAAGLGYLYRYSQRRRRDPRFQPVVLRTLSSPGIPVTTIKKGPGLPA